MTIKCEVKLTTPKGTPLKWSLTYCGDAREKFKNFPSTSCSFWKCCETFGSRCFKIGKLILPSICFQAILSPLDRSCLSYEIFKSIESCKLNKTTYISPYIIIWTNMINMFMLASPKCSYIRVYESLQNSGLLDKEGHNT